MAHSSYLKLNAHTIKLLILIGIIPPLYFQLSNFIAYDIYKISSIGSFLFWSGLSIAITILLAIIVLQEIKWIDKWLPWRKTVGFRILVELLITNATVLSAMAVLAHFSYEWHCQFLPGTITFKTHLLQELTLGVVLLIIMIGITEGTYFFREWKKSLLLAEKLKKEALEAQLESLKNQVNPHFLFNSLNVLSTLVHKDADRAEEFIDQFAAVYRYVLNIQDKLAVTLGEELEFLNSYIFLQQIRFQQGLQVKIDISENCYGHYIVPLSLQMLVENAIKHNVVSREDPLTVNIFLDGDSIHIENKINLRKDENKSVGMGLKNLRNRYFLLAGIMPEIKKEQEHFIAAIPLIKPEKSEHKQDDDKRCNHRGRTIRR